MKTSRALLCCLALLFVPGIVLANTALPGPIIWQGVIGADSIVRYILAVGLICVGVMERSGRMPHGKSMFWPVFWANILSNAMIFGLLIWKLE